LSKIEANLKNILYAIEKIERYSGDFKDTESFYNDQKSFDAILMQFVVIGEVVNRLDEAFRDVTSNIPWREIKGFRNIIAHDYFGVDADEVWEIINSKIIPLKKRDKKFIIRLKIDGNFRL
jgi:uncharacterized protein with HEPN domain